MGFWHDDRPALLIRMSGIKLMPAKTFCTETSSVTSAVAVTTLQPGALAWISALASSRAEAVRPVIMTVLAPARAKWSAVA